MIRLKYIILLLIDQREVKFAEFILPEVFLVGWFSVAGVSDGFFDLMKCLASRLGKQ